MGKTQDKRIPLPQHDLAFRRNRSDWCQKALSPAEILAAHEKLPENERALELAVYAYRFFAVKGSDLPADRFLQFWVNLTFLSTNTGKDPIGRFFAAKELQKRLHDTKFISIFTSHPEMLQKIRYEQLYNSAVRYLVTCQNDKNYTHYMYGLFTIKEEQLNQKIIESFLRTSVCFPFQIGLLSTFPEVAMAGYDALIETYPQMEERAQKEIMAQLSHHEGNVLLQLLQSS